jgi:hypothetical protein
MITWQKLVFDKDCCIQAFRLLLTRIKSIRKSNTSSAKRLMYATACPSGGEDENDANDDLMSAKSSPRWYSKHSERSISSSKRQQQEEYDEDGETAEVTAASKPTPPPLRNSLRSKLLGRKSVTSSRNSSLNDTALPEWNSNTSVGPSDDRGVSSSVSVNQIGEEFDVSSSIIVQRTQKTSIVASKLKKGQMQELQLENAALKEENRKLQEEIQHLEQLNAALNGSHQDNQSDIDNLRLRWLQAQNLQLQRQVYLMHQALLTRQDTEGSLMTTLHSLQDLARKGMEEAKSAGATDKTENGQKIKWMMAVPDNLLEDLVQLEKHVMEISKTFKFAYESKLRISTTSASFLKQAPSDVNIVSLNEIFSSNLSHLRLDRLQKLEDKLVNLCKELEVLQQYTRNQMSPHLFSRQKALVTNTCRSLVQTSRELALEIAHLGAVVGFQSTGTNSKEFDVKEVEQEDIRGALRTVLKFLPPSTSITSAAHKERQTQVKSILKRLNAHVEASSYTSNVSKRELDGLWKGWKLQEEQALALMHRIRSLGNSKVNWLQQNISYALTSLTEVMEAFRAHETSSSSSRKNPMTQLLLDTFTSQKNFLLDAKTHLDEYTRKVVYEMDNWVKDFEDVHQQLMDKYLSRTGQRNEENSIENSQMPNVNCYE